MTKAFDHNARKYWILNVGDLKPAEIDIDYFLQLATDEPRMAKMSQRDFLVQWLAEQFPTTAATSSTGDVTRPGAPSMTALPSWVGDRSNRSLAAHLADVMTDYYSLNFIRKPEFMGFNGYNDGINRTAFNPFAWGDSNYPEALDQNDTRIRQWGELQDTEGAIAKTIAPGYRDAFFELVGYPVEASAAMNLKFLWTDRSFSDFIPWVPGSWGPQGSVASLIAGDSTEARAAYDTIQSLTAKYNSLQNGKWDGIMSAAPRDRHVFEMPRTATLADADKPLPASWGAGDAACQRAVSPPAPSNPAHTSTFAEQHCTVSINAAHFTRKFDGTASHWNILADLGISGASVVYGAPGLLANQPPPQQAPWLDYDFTTTTNGPATLALHLLPTFAIDSGHRLRYAVALDGHAPIELDASGPDGHGPDTATWSANVLRNSAIATIPLGPLAAGPHTIRLLYRDPGVVFEHLVLTFSGAPPAYPVPPETR
jgi:hypothetical protein